MNYYLARDGQTYGPYPDESIPTMLQAGQVVPEDLLCAEGGSEWIPVNQIPAFAAATPPPVPQMAAASTAPGGLRISAAVQAPATKYVPAPTLDWEPATQAKASMAERAGSFLRTLKWIGYGIAALVIAGIGIAGYIKAQGEAKEIEKLHALPGWNAFASGNEKIDSESSEAGYGNTSAAGQLSSRLASVLGTAQQARFAMEKSGYHGRSKIGIIVSAVDSANAGAGKFQTFLEMRDDRAILLIHVPEFKRYKDETREAMRQMCWEVARVAVTGAKRVERNRAAQPPSSTRPSTRTRQPRTQTNNIARANPPAAAQPPDFTLVVGLRDKSSYDCVLAGKLSDLTLTEENVPEAATGNVPSHALLVKWFGTEKPN